MSNRPIGHVADHTEWQQRPQVAALGTTHRDAGRHNHDDAGADRAHTGNHTTPQEPISC